MLNSHFHPKKRSAARRLVVIVCGAIICLTYTCIIIWMFSQRPVTSEDDERIADAFRDGKNTQWTPPYDFPDNKRVATMTKDVLVSYFRLRIFVLLDLAPFTGCESRSGAAASCRLQNDASRVFTLEEHAPVLASLMHANYENHKQLIDVDIVTYASAPSVGSGQASVGNRSATAAAMPPYVREGLRRFQWRHGRVNVQDKGELTSDVRDGVLLTQSWAPTSEWEFALFLRSQDALSVYWYQWWELALNRYILHEPDGKPVTLSTVAPLPPYTPATWGNLRRMTKAPSAESKPRPGAIVSPFSVQPLTCVVLPATPHENMAEEKERKLTHSQLTITPRFITGTIWSAEAWTRFLEWSRTQTLVSTAASEKDLAAAWHTFMVETTTAGRCVETKFPFANTLFRHAAETPSSLQKLMVDDRFNNLSKIEFEQGFGVFPMLGIAVWSPA